jgi:cold-inducible RNA-binding protein
MTDRLTGQPRGFAFVEMADDADAAKAILAVNGIALNGRAMNVSAARPQLYRNSGGVDSRLRAD